MCCYVLVIGFNRALTGNALKRRERQMVINFPSENSNGYHGQRNHEVKIFSFVPRPNFFSQGKQFGEPNVFLSGVGWE